MTARALKCLIVLLFVSQAAFGQTGSVNRDAAASRDAQYEIHGKLIFSSTNPPEDRIEVILERNMQRVTSAFTDSLGNFDFRALAPGSYNILVHLPDYEDVNQSVELFTTQRATSVAIPMNKLFEVVRKERPGFEGDDPDVIDVKMMTRTYPKKAVQEYEKALEETKKGAADKAIQHLQEAIRLAPDFYHAHNNLGVAYQKLKRYDEAESSFRKAIELNPKAQQPELNLGILFINEAEARRAEGFDVVGKLLDNAMDALDEAIRLKPNSALAHYYLGAAYYKSNFLEEAEASLKKAQYYEPAMAPSHLMLINVYVKEKRWKDAIDQIDAYLRENPKAEDRNSIQDMRDKIAKGMASPF